MNVKKLQKICVEISKLKQQLVEELPHYSNQALYFQNNEISTGIINDKTEIKETQMFYSIGNFVLSLCAET